MLTPSMLFFPVGETGPAVEAQVADAKSVCAGCPVLAECLADASGCRTASLAG